VFHHAGKFLLKNRAGNEETILKTKDQKNQIKLDRNDVDDMNGCFEKNRRRGE
jgi:hypothetical protein